ncbi:lipoprotein [Spiroplasma alleghenense]|uniref:Lipoprotein n=1 Tax=Spiroplasma alleghenense TaxID=216931 RepID=A0A345Z4J0_9MOLU|nr:lipoprotein [Spiroplasma alleghenense]AXK51519.1 hypothetical protein SALLE_v1c08490 [Spiroplasma alleghenense]
MKKLLSIFAATTLAVSAPLSVVACKKGNSDNGEEFDYDALKKQLIDEMTLIINENINQDFEKYLFLKDEEAQKKFDSISIIKILDILSQEDVDSLQLNQNSTNFINISKDLKGVIDLAKLGNEINKNIVQNINFKPILINGQSPFKNDVETKSIKLLKKSNEVVSIEFNFGFNLALQEANGDVLNESINFHQIMNIFEDINIVDDLNDLSQSIVKQLESDKYSNSFSFISNSGNFLEVTEKINADSSIKSKINEAVDEAQKLTENSERFTINLENKNLKTNKNYIIPGESQSYSFSAGTWDSFEDDVWTEGLLSALISRGSEEIENWSRKMSQRSFDDVTLSRFQKMSPSKAVQNFVLNDETSSIAINHYNIEEYLNNENLFKLFKKRILNSKLKIDHDDDKKTIAIWGTDLENISVTYTETYSNTEITIEMPDFYLINRQETSLDDTNEFTYKFNVSWLELLRKFFGYENFNVNENPEMIYNLELPPDIIEELEVGVSYNSRTIILAAFEKALEDISINNNLAKEFISYFSIFPAYENSEAFIKINSDGYIYSFGPNGEMMGFQFPSVSWRGGGVDFNDARNEINQYRNFLGRKNSQPDQFGDSPTKWKIIDFKK